MLILFLFSQFSDDFADFSSIIALIGVIISVSWQAYSYFHKTSNERTENEREEDAKKEELNLVESRKIREETRQLLEDAKSEIKDYEDKVALLEIKYNRLFYSKIRLEIEVAVMNYEHQLLFDRLDPEVMTGLKERVENFRNSLNGRFMRDIVNEEIKKEEAK